MSNFNPRDPITDPSVFCPRGMYVDNRRSNKVVGFSISNEEDDDAAKSFVFDSSDMKALNRFLSTGRKLQATRAEYLGWLRILDNPAEVSTEVGKEVDILVRTYSSIKKDCEKFEDATWIRIVELAVDIKTYATMSGGKADTSYYVLMLDSIGQYHVENKKSNPDKAKLAELKQSIQFTVDAKLKKLGELQAGTSEALTGLSKFERVCEAHGVAVDANKTSLARQLYTEGSVVQSLGQKIDESVAEINVLQKRIDEQNKIIKNAAKIIVLFPIGSIIGLAQSLAAKNERDKLLKAMEKVKELLDDDRTKTRAATRLLLNLKFISGQVYGLSEEIGPTIKTLQKLQGAWKNMETDLKSIKDLIDFDVGSIPPMLITRPQLQGIVDEWNELKEYASQYIEIAYISDEPKSMTINEYIDELKASMKSIEAMQEEVKG
ncbi:hypothetical protein EsDP_00002898 [Epichloe bromicola]|uniref:Uncharacterized protein n=1 Tax=Epichloe bromicola TaxID=79588 RepID=A0ABQ0CM82_9HYPO